MLETHLRQASTLLLESAIRIAPPDMQDWGRAMMGELNYVEGPWAALMWALGGAGVLAKHALAALFIPGRRGQSVVPDGIFAKRISLRRVALAGSAACVLGALLFLAAPPFRQAVRVSLGAWREAVRPARLRSQPALLALAKQAEAHHDPEGLAFVAVRLHDDCESARLADEAVQLDATITWIYAAIAVRHPLIPTGEWVPKLEHWAPENAFVHLIKAQSIRMATFHRICNASWKRRATEVQSDPAWQAAMAAAFAAPKFDDYVDRLANLDRNVEVRYRFDDPYEVLFGAQQAVMFAGVNGRFSSSDADDSQSFAKSLIEEGQRLENRGNRKGAAGKYWAVARFGQLLDSQGHFFDHEEGATLQAMAYRRLGALWEEQGDHNEAALFAYLTEKFDRPLTMPNRSQAEWAWGHDISMRNGAVFQIAGLTMLVFFGLFILAVLVLMVVGWPRAKLGTPRVKVGATALAFTSAIGVLLSSATVYLTYRPYWYILQHAIQTGDNGQTRDLLTFLLAIKSLAIIEAGVSSDLHIYFWAGVTLLGVSGLVLIFLRHLLGRPHAHAP
jgi:hypothetical protein